MQAALLHHVASARRQLWPPVPREKRTKRKLTGPHSAEQSRKQGRSRFWLRVTAVSVLRHTEGLSVPLVEEIGPTHTTLTRVPNFQTRTRLVHGRPSHRYAAAASRVADSTHPLCMVQMPWAGKCPSDSTERSPQSHVPRQARFFSSFSWCNRTIF